MIRDECEHGVRDDDDDVRHMGHCEIVTERGMCGGSTIRLQPPSGFSDSRELSEAECDRDRDRDREMSHRRLSSAGSSKLPADLAALLSRCNTSPFNPLGQPLPPARVVLAAEVDNTA